MIAGRGGAGMGRAGRYSKPTGVGSTAEFGVSRVMTVKLNQ
ncbi:MAG TPA: hypothetical protein VHV75_11385 [Solirubrobacteraceae bacterium]|nr:hypothetical protein [Solirubrobacteraceae bacterium]